MAHFGYKVSPGESVDLSKYDPGHHAGLTEHEARDQIAVLSAKLEELQELLYAAGTHGCLIVLQGLDTAGKDGTIRTLSTCMNVQHTSVSSFKQPTALEASHDFLWRIHKQAPGRSEIGIFNRSHYEDVLVVRVHDLVPKSVWKERYDQINDFEERIASSDVIIAKFFLHISKGEQEQRLLAREADKTKGWKLSVGDWKERQFWDEYTKAYEAALTKCSTKQAPWYIIPANHKWFRDLCILHTLVDTLEDYKKSWNKSLMKRAAVAEQELAAYRATQ